MLKSKTPSWREVLPVHPAADLFPIMSPDELRSLGEDIKKRGLLEGVAMLDGMVLDGRNRLAAMEMVGIKLVTANGQPEWVNIPTRNVKGCDPVAFVISKNIHRRHLTAEQKRDLIAKLLKATPEKSNRQIAETMKVDHKTVGAVRADLEGRGEIPHVGTRTDTKGRKQQASKPKPKAGKPTTPTREKVIADLDAAVAPLIAHSEESQPAQSLLTASAQAACVAQGRKDTFDLLAHMIGEEAAYLSGDRRTEFLMHLRDLIEELLHNVNGERNHAPAF